MSYPKPILVDDIFDVSNGGVDDVCDDDDVSVLDHHRKRVRKD